MSNNEYQQKFKNFFNLQDPQLFENFLQSLPNDETRIELIRNDKDTMEEMIVFEHYRDKLKIFLNLIQSDEKKLEIIQEIWDNYKYSKIYFPFEILDLVKPEDRLNFIINTDFDKKEKFLKSIFIPLEDEDSKNNIKKIFFDDGEDFIDEKFQKLYRAHQNFKILSFLANKDDFGSSGLKYQFAQHLPAIKEKFQKNPLPEIYHELFEKMNSDKPIDLKDGNKLFIRDSRLSGHVSYFIFHVNAQNKLTKISYCDGNKVSDQRSIVGSCTHINSITNYELANPIDFSAEFADKFIKENSQKEDFIDFYNKISAENFKFKGLEETSISSITYEMPRQKQKRGNCAMKSANILACAILQLKDPSQEFRWDGRKITGAGYDNYKEFKDELSKLALMELKQTMLEIQGMKPEKEGYRRDLFEVLEEFF
ncbi:MAG: hypothetical protein ACO26G_02540 [Rickettsiales bacterium]